MALKQLMISKKIEQRKANLLEVVAQQEKINTRTSELENLINEAKTDDEVSTVESEVIKLDAEKEELEGLKNSLEEEIAGLEGELEQLNSKIPSNEKRSDNSMHNREIRDGISEYIRSKGQVRAGFTSVEGGALVPVEILAPEKAVEDVVDLSKLIRVRKVNSGSGKYPVIKKSGSTMTSVSELAKNPELAKPSISDVAYDIETYRGYIPVSQEIIDDADYDITSLISEEILDQELNTKNKEIATILKTATSKSITGLDGLKKVFNVDLKKAYTPKAIISSSLYNELDTAKDNNGRYLLQDDVTLSSGKRLFGKEVVVLDDDMIGQNDGDLVGFIGDPKAFCTLFDRKRASVKWVDNDVYGQLLAGFIRFDVEVTDEDAGFYIDYTPEP